MTIQMGASGLLVVMNTCATGTCITSRSRINTIKPPSVPTDKKIYNVVTSHNFLSPISSCLCRHVDFHLAEHINFAQHSPLHYMLHAYIAWHSFMYTVCLYVYKNIYLYIYYISVPVVGTWAGDDPGGNWLA